MLRVSPEQQSALRDVYAFARKNTYSDLYRDLPEPKGEATELLRHMPILTKKQLQDAERLSHYPNREVRYLTSTFDPEAVDDLFLVPQHISEPWPQFSKLLTDVQPQVALLSVPLVWQIAPYVYHTCRENKTPLSVVSYRNLPLARQIIRETNAQLVVSTPDIARDLFALLKEEGMHNQIRAWLLITPLGHSPEIPMLPGAVIVEQHVFPGVPVGYTERSSMTHAERGTSFNLGEGWLLEKNETGGSLLTSLTKRALPLMRFDVGARFTHEKRTYGYDE